MPIYLIGYNTETGKQVGVLSSGFVDFNEQVTGSPKQDFNVTATYNIQTGQKIDVWVDGRKQIPNVHFTVNYTTNIISLNENVQVGVWVEIRIYL